MTTILDIAAERLIALHFWRSLYAPPSEKRITQVLRRILSSINSYENGYAVQLFMVGGSWTTFSQDDTPDQVTAILSLWDPTGRDEDLPISASDVKQRLESAITALSGRSKIPRPSIVDLGSERNLLSNQLVFTPNEIFRARESYVYKHGLAQEVTAVLSS